MSRPETLERKYAGKLPPDAQSFMYNLLALDPSARLTCTQCLQVRRWKTGGECMSVGVKVCMVVSVSVSVSLIVDVGVGVGNWVWVSVA